MATSRKVTGNGSAAFKVNTDPNTVQILRADEVHADYNWNARTNLAEDTTDEKTGSGDRGFLGNVLSIAADGQKTPCVVRPNPNYGKKGEKPYLLVSGFTRYRIITGLAAGEWQDELTNPTKGGMTHAAAAALKTKTPTIRCFVRNLDEGQAIEENIAENVQRNNLNPVDLALAVMRYRTRNPNVSDESVAVKFNKNQSYVSRVKRIAEGLGNVTLPPGSLHKGSPATNLLDAWRHDTIQVPQEKLVAIAAEKDPAARAEKYLAARKEKSGDGDGPKKAATGPGAWIVNACDRDVPVMAAMLVKLQRMGVVSIEKPIEGKEAIAAFLQPKRNLPGDVSEDQLDKLAGAIETHIEKAKKELKEAAKAAAAKAAEPKAETPAKGKAAKAAAVNGARA